MDEPESVGAIGLGGREQLDNLIWVVNCNLQQLDGPVRGNAKIIQELEADLRGAGWNVIKVIWGSRWDPLLALGGGLPARRRTAEPLPVPRLEEFHSVLEGNGAREISTTMAFVRVLAALLRDKAIAPHIVPVVPNESRTFGMEGMFRQIGMYSPLGQLYQPQDSALLTFYKEDQHGQIPEEGITEAGSISSFIAVGTSYGTHGVQMVPFYTYYWMFGYQRVGDLVWAAGDSRTRGFMLGGTAGRTTLNGEGLQQALADEGSVEVTRVQEAIGRYEIDPDTPMPTTI